MRDSTTRAIDEITRTATDEITSLVDSTRNEAYLNGLENGKIEGKEVGYKEGYEEGKKDGRREVLEELGDTASNGDFIDLYNQLVEKEL